jgi:hypothetical protein
MHDHQQPSRPVLDGIWLLVAAVAVVAALAVLLRFGMGSA